MTPLQSPEQAYYVFINSTWKQDKPTFFAKSSADLLIRSPMNSTWKQGKSTPLQSSMQAY